MLLADLGATVIKVESPAGDDTRTWMPPENGGVATYYQSINRNKRSDRARLRRRRRRRPRPRAAAPRRHRHRELPARQPRQVRPRLSPRRAAQPAADLPVDHRLRHGGGSLAARLRPRGPSGLRADEPHRRTRRTRLPVRRRRVRRDDRAARDDRRPRRPPATRRHRARPARRGQPAVVGVVGPRQPVRRLHRWGSGAPPHGQRPPERLPVSADADEGPRRDHHGRQRSPVPVAVRGARHRRDRRRRTIPAQRRSHRQP